MIHYIYIYKNNIYAIMRFSSKHERDQKEIYKYDGKNMSIHKLSC